MHRFILTEFRRLISESYSGTMIAGVQLIPKISMVIADKLGEHVILCLKGRDSFMDCSLCTLHSRVQRGHRQDISPENSSEEDCIIRRRPKRAARNNHAQLYTKSDRSRSMSDTIRCQLPFSNNNIATHFNTSQIQANKELIIKRAHGLPTALA